MRRHATKRQRRAGSSRRTRGLRSSPSGRLREIQTDPQTAWSKEDVSRHDGIAQRKRSDPESLGRERRCGCHRHRENSLMRCKNKISFTRIVPGNATSGQRHERAERVCGLPIAPDRNGFCAQCENAIFEQHEAAIGEDQEFEFERASNRGTW